MMRQPAQPDGRRTVSLRSSLPDPPLTGGSSDTVAIAPAGGGSPGAAVALPAAPARRFGALRHRDFVLFWTGNIASNTGYWMQLVAQGFLIYQLTGSKTLLGMVGLARAIPLLIFPLIGGVVADRVDRVRLLYVTQSSQALVALCLAVLVSAGLVAPWHIIAASFLGGLFGAFDQPARRSLVPDLVPRQDLLSATSLESSVFNGAAFTGPALYGLLAPFIGIAGAFYANAFSYVAVLVMLALIRVPRRPASESRASMLENLLEGLRYVRGHPVLLTVVVLAATTSFFARSYQQLLPALLQDVLLPGEAAEVQLVLQSYLTSAAGAGTLLAAFALTALGGVRRKGMMLFGSVLAFAVALALFSVSQVYWLSLALLVGVGATNLIFGATASTISQTIAPRELRGRVMSLHTLTFLGFSPLGAGFIGPLADLIGVSGALALGAVVVAVVAFALMVSRPQVRALE
jgi:MFS family permease